MFPRHGIFFESFESGAINPCFIPYSMALKKLLSMVSVMCHMYNRESPTTSVVVVCEDYWHHVCKHISAEQYYAH